ncbi:RNA-directed DNA polymerase, eukaryota [Tanacetum coccineum]
MFRMVDVGGLAISSAGSLMWPEWDPCRARVRCYHDCGRGFPSADDSESVDGMRKRPKCSALQFNSLASKVSARCDGRGGGGAEGVQLEEVSKLIDSIELVEEQDKWVWNLEGDGEFMVVSARRFIDEGLSEMEGVQTRWVKLVPIKVNVFAWRLALNKLPTWFNMSSRGLEIPSIVCPVCNVGADTVDHLFFSCSVASSIMAKILGWWGLLENGVSTYHSWVS